MYRAIKIIIIYVIVKLYLRALTKKIDGRAFMAFAEYLLLKSFPEFACYWHVTPVRDCVLKVKGLSVHHKERIIVLLVQICIGKIFHEPAESLGVKNEIIITFIATCGAGGTLKFNKHKKFVIIVIALLFKASLTPVAFDMYPPTALLFQRPRTPLAESLLSTTT